MRILYECKKCSTVIEPDTKKKLKFCKCGKIGIDGSYTSSRVIGDKNFLICKSEKEEYVYRIKNLESGLYFNPYSWPKKAFFNTIGKFYSRKPSVKWGNALRKGECIVEKYKIEKF